MPTVWKLIVPTTLPSDAGLDELSGFGTASGLPAGGFDGGFFKHNSYLFGVGAGSTGLFGSGSPGAGSCGTKLGSGSPGSGIFWH